MAYGLAALRPYGLAALRPYGTELGFEPCYRAASFAQLGCLVVRHGVSFGTLPSMHASVSMYACPNALCKAACRTHMHACMQPFVSLSACLSVNLSIQSVDPSICSLTYQPRHAHQSNHPCMHTPMHVRIDG